MFTCHVFLVNLIAHHYLTPDLTRLRNSMEDSYCHFLAKCISQLKWMVCAFSIDLVCLV